MFRRGLICLFLALVVGAMCCAAAGTGDKKVLLPVLVDGKWGYIDTAGEMVIGPQFDEANRFVEGRGLVGIKKRQDGKCLYGFVDDQGRYVVQPIYVAAKDFSEGLAATAIQTETGPLFGYIDAYGNMVIEPQFRGAGRFFEGLAWVDIGEKVGYIDRRGKVVIRPWLDCGRDFHEGLAAVILPGERNRVAYMNRRGRIVIPSALSYNPHDFSGGLVRLEIDMDDYGYTVFRFVDRRGRPAFERTLLGAGDFSEGLAWAQDHQWRDRLIDTEGRIVVTLGRYNGKFVHMEHPFSEGLALVSTGDPVKGDFRYGFVDRMGRVVIPIRFFEAESFKDGCARVLDGGKGYGYLNRTGKWIWEPTR